MEFVKLFVQTYNTVNKDYSKDSANDKIFKLRRKDKKTFDYDKMSSEKQIFYAHSGKGSRESIVRNILEKLYDQPFPSCRPYWLVNPKSKRRLEIDCFNKTLRIGVEIDGIQHSTYLPHFHKTYDEFLEQQERDMTKNNLIKKRGVRLVRIPHHIKTNDLEKYLIGELFKRL